MNMSPQEMQHHHMNIPVVEPVYPHLGRAQENSKSPLFTLEEAQRLAVESNPTLRQAEAEIRASKARQQQSGLYPNPTVAYTGDEIRGGSGGGGKQGFFVQQTVVTAGKLARSRDVFSKEMLLAEIEAQEQKIRVETSVKTAFLRVLAAQELSRTSAATSPKSSRISPNPSAISLILARPMNLKSSTPKSTPSAFASPPACRKILSAKNGAPSPRSSAAPIFRSPPSPAISNTIGPTSTKTRPSSPSPRNLLLTRIADASAACASAELRARQTRTHSSISKSVAAWSTTMNFSTPRNHAKGWEGIAEVSVQIPVFNRNQGNIAAASASA